MPIFIKKYIWKQSDDIIYIEVPVIGVCSSKIDILISDNFLKMSFPPFIFQAFLLHQIDENESTCTIFKNEVKFELLKKDKINWEKLEKDLTKQEKVQYISKTIEEQQIENRRKLDDKIEKKSKLKKFTVQESMEIDNKELQCINKKRDGITQQAIDELEEWKQAINKCETKHNQNINNSELKKSKNIIGKIDNTVRFNETNDSILLNKKKISKIPPIRQSDTLIVTFTERNFPTPSRESSAREEEIWLKKINEARRASGFISEDLRPEEHNPQWCKDKGDELFRTENYLGAINAYTHGIKLSNKLPSLFSNRAATHFAMGNFHKCVEDCSTALDLMVPHCQSNLASRVKCIVRRAAALTRIGMLSKAIDELKFAIKLQPENQKLKGDLYSMERAWEQDPDSD